MLPRGAGGLAVLIVSCLCLDVPVLRSEVRAAGTAEEREKRSEETNLPPRGSMTRYIHE